MPGLEGFSTETVEESPIDIDVSFENASRLGFSAGDQIKTPDGNAEVLGGSETEKGKVYYRIEGETEVRFFVAKNKQQVKEKGFALVRPVVAKRPKKAKLVLKESISEKKEEIGEKAEILINKYFESIPSDGEYWNWQISDDGKYIDMQASPSDIASKELKEDRPETNRSGKGKEDLLKELRGKRIIGVNYNNQDFFLEVVGDEDEDIKKKDLESKEGVVENAEVLVDRFFETKNSNTSSKDSWNWEFSKDGKFIRMYCGVSDVPEGIITKNTSVVSSDFIGGKQGGDNLKSKLNGKKVIGVNYDGSFYLEIVDNESLPNGVKEYVGEDGQRYLAGTTESDMSPYTNKFGLKIGDKVNSGSYGSGTVLGVLKKSVPGSGSEGTLLVSFNLDSGLLLNTYRDFDIEALLGIKEKTQQEQNTKIYENDGEKYVVNTSNEKMSPYTERFNLRVGDKVNVGSGAGTRGPGEVLGVLSEGSTRLTGYIGELFIRSENGRLYPYSLNEIEDRFIFDKKIESKEGVGEDAEIFIKRYFDSKGVYGSSRENWGWQISDDERYVTMRSDIENTPAGFASKTISGSEPEFETTEYGEDELLKRLKGKKVVGVNYDGSFYLEIVGDNKEQKENVAPYYELYGEKYELDTSEEALKSFDKRLNFKAGDRIEDNDNDQSIVLGIKKQDGTLVLKFDNESFGQNGYIFYDNESSDLEDILSGTQYLKEESDDEDIKIYETDGEKIEADISKEAFKEYSDIFTFSIGSTAKEVGGTEYEILGIVKESSLSSVTEGELLVRAVNTGRYFSCNKRTAENAFREYLKSENVKTYENREGGTYEVDTSEEAFAPYAKLYSFKPGEAVLEKRGSTRNQRVKILGICTGGTAVNARKGQLIILSEESGDYDDGYRAWGESESKEVFSAYLKTESKEEAGEDSGVLIDRFFKEKSRGDGESNWAWKISTDGKYIDMQWGVANTPSGIFRKELNALTSDFNEQERGADRLKERLRGKKVIGVKYEGRFYLEIVGEGTESKSNITTYETDDNTYEVNTSPEAFKTFSDKFAIEIGQDLEDNDGDDLKILGVSDERMVVKYSDTNIGDEGFEYFDLDRAKLRLEYYIKPIVINEFLTRYPFENEIVISTKNEDLQKFKKEFVFETNELFNDTDGDRGRVLGVIVESEDSSEDIGKLVIKYENSSTGYIYLNKKDVALYLEKINKKEQPTEEGLKHKEALIAKASRLKNSAPFQALADLLAHDPNLKNEYRIVLDRLEEFKKSHISPDERHRAYTAMLSSIMLSPRLSKLFERVIDKTIEEESDEIRESIENGGNYVYEVVLGTGIHGTIYNIARQMHFPKNPSLTADQNRKIGGQFGQYGGDAFRLNSRTRPEQRGKDYLPGTGQTLNTFTEFATMQPSDTTAMSYSYQTALARNSRTNFFLSGKALTQVELQKVKRNIEDPENNKLVLEFLDKETGKLMEIKTDRLILASGLGKEITRLNEKDPETKRILVEEEAKLENDNNPQVLPFTKFVEWMTNVKNPFPQKDMKKIIISGSGDSGAVIAGMLLGYEGQYAKTTTQLDNVEQIIWLGQDLPTKEKFVESVRLRYSQIGLEFPREKIENYYSRIVPVNARSERLRRNGENIVVIDDSGDTYEGDHFIYAHGFKDTTDKVVNSWYNTTISSSTGIEAALTRNLTRTLRNGTEIIYKKTTQNGVKRLQVIDGDDGAIATIRLVRGDGSFEEQTIVTNKLIDDFYKEFLTSENIKNISISENSNRARDNQTNLYDPEMSTESPIALQYEAYDQPEDAPIYKVGPSSKLPLTEEEIDKSPALANIPENTAAVFRYAKYTEGTAALLSKIDKKSPEILEKIKNSVTTVKDKKDGVDLEKLTKTGIFKGKNSNFIALVEKQDILAYDENLYDTGRFAIGQFFEEYKFGNTNETIEISLKKDSDNVYSGTITPAVEDVSLVEKMLQDDLVGSVVSRLMEQKNNRNEKLIIRIPFVKGRVDSSNIATTVPRS